MSLRFRTASAAVLILALVACGGGGSGGDSESGPRGDDVWAACTEAPRAALSAPAGATSCADSGLDPTSDQFAFPNWGGPPATDTFTPSLAATIYGTDAVCMDLTNGCVVYPAAQQWMDQMNAAIQGGRCEGMATLSQRVLDGEDLPSDLQGGAVATVDLVKEELTVGGSIAKWWASQTFPEVRKPTKKTRDLDPVEIAEHIIVALQNGEGPTLGLYGDGVAHAVTPVAVTTDGADAISIHVYDNNFPGQITTVHVDRTTKTWKYDTAATNSDNAASVWSGGKGTLDLTLMSDREVQPSPTWSNEDAAKGVTRVVITTGGVSAAGVIVTVGDTVLDSRDLTQTIDGIDVFPFRGNYFGTGAMVEISTALGAVRIQPVLGALLNAQAKTVPFTFGIDAPGAAAFQVNGDVDASEIDSELPVAEVVPSDDDYEFGLEGEGEYLIDMALEEEGVEFEVDGEVTFEFTDGEESEAQVALLDGEGEELWTDEFDGVDDDGEYGGTSVSYDEESGDLAEEEYVYEPYELDEELLAELEEDFPTADEIAEDETESTDPDSEEEVTDDSSNDDSDQTDDTSTGDTSSDDTVEEVDDSEPEESTTTTQPDEVPVETDAPIETDAPVETDPPAEEPPVE